ncbi:zinc-binding dehydrogenase [Amycolatopsis sp. WQ 127309]|uniref:zinc-binding dehydrogenase n=1 Tax=Amycolatopsis sp. WQ 127309 TaxID=2932773 RepID=UPI001FF2CD81|nr:zinc-binding dehydrogenase [Amycolatopsis sp. WQ 127309]UOZ07005.1 zinc-binding dehydrogenase [Amycolatopsis sp. WQ 127309]
MSRLAAPPDTATWCLGMPFPGSLNRISYQEHNRGTNPLRPHEIRVEVRAAALNFRDLLTAVGRIPPAAGSLTLGFEGAGVVTETGCAVAGFGVGDRVFGLLPAAFSRFSVTDHRHVAEVPSTLSFPVAATLAVAFLTAWHTLVDVAGIRAGQRVLVHASAGGVGTAAVQLARLCGAEVYGTAHPAKWHRLAQLGLAANRLSSSRDPSFARRLSAQLGSAPLDVVLNCLTGRFVDASLDLLGPGGTFVEIGKTDVRSATGRPDVRYRVADIDDLGPRTGEILGLVTDHIERGELTPLPFTEFAVEEARKAFRLMASAGHFGKIVLALPSH